MRINNLPLFVLSNFFFAVMLIMSGCSLVPSSPTLGVESTSEKESSPSNIVSTTAVVLPYQEATLRFRNNASYVRILVNRGDYVEAGDVLVESDTFQQTLVVDEAKAQLTSARAFYEGLLREEFREVRQSEKDAAFEQIEAAEAALDLAEENLAATSIIAPFSGTIIDIYVDTFENLFAGEPILLIADVANFKIETDDLDEKEVARVEIGDRVRIFFDSIPDATASGVVTNIAIKSTSGAGNDFPVTISVLDAVKNMRWGMSAYVEIETGSADDKTAGNEVELPAISITTGETSAPPPERRTCERIDFLSETIPDGSVLAAGKTFTKSWVFRNIGTCTLNTDYRLVYISGDMMDGQPEIPFSGYVAPNDLMTVELALTAPEIEGEYRGDWQLQNDLGAKLYDVWVDIRVGETP